MPGLERVVVAACGLVVIALGLAALGLGLGWNPSGLAVELITDVLSGGRLGSVLVGLLLLVGGGRAVAIVLRGRRMADAVVNQTELGQVRISLKAIEALVRRAVEQVRGTREVRVALEVAAEGVGVDLDVQVAPDTNIPAAAAEMQQRVEAYVRETVGVTVSGVHVRVRGVATERAARTV